MQLILDAIARRRDLIARLTAEGTDCFRLFHGRVEGWPGLTIDSYGPLVLVQSSKVELEADTLAELKRLFEGRPLVYRHRHQGRSREIFHTAEAHQEFSVRELGLEYVVRGQMSGLDPDLFLDLRAVRRAIHGLAPGQSVLNLFAYTCGLGLVAAAGGASSVWNVDFSGSALELGARNFARNGVTGEFVKEDCFPVLWQLAGQAVKGKAARRRRFRKFEPRQFQLVMLDPPRRAVGPFGAVDLVRDYQSLFKPCLAICAQRGAILATNNVAAVGHEEFADLLDRCARKAGRPLSRLEWIAPDEDFPSADGLHPLKAVLCHPE
ncbi:MAG: class I SAM-dependent methyltransferase [Candidatus Eremiobacteraeota bacterium]|nr:class I SAM-dependent methyltransferase [Candidatus Eremiobacteraeota bacterium]